MCFPTISSPTPGSKDLPFGCNPAPHLVHSAFSAACLAEQKQWAVYGFLLMGAQISASWLQEPYSEVFKICASSAAFQKAAGTRVGVMRVAISARGMQTLFHSNSSKPTKTQITFLWTTSDSSSNRSTLHLKLCPGTLMVQFQVENKACRQVQKHFRNQSR